MEHVLTMANLKLKPSLFTPRPTVQCSPFLRHLQWKLLHRVLHEYAMISKHAEGMGLRHIKIASNLPSQHFQPMVSILREVLV